MRRPWKAAAVAAVSSTGLCALALAVAAPMAQAATTSGPAHPTLWVSGATAMGGNGTSCAHPGYNTVQAAVTAAPAGATVKVCAGTYTEQVEITKSLTLTGTGGRATLTLPASPANSAACASTASSQYGVDVCGPIHVTLSHLVIDSAWSSGTCNDDLDAVFVAGGATLEFSSSAVTAAGAVPINGCQGGIGVLVTGGHLKMSDSAVSGYQKNGITIKGTGSTATVAGVKVTGAGPTPEIAQNGIEVAEGAWASITGSTVRGNECDVSVCGPDSLSQTQSTGVLFFDAAPGSVLSHSTASGNDIGVYFLAASDIQTGAWIGHDSVVNNRYEDICLDQGKAEIDGTQIRGGNVALQAIQYVGQTAGIDSYASHDTIGPSGVHALQVYSDQGSGDLAGKLVVSHSTIHGSVSNNSPATAPVVLTLSHS